MNVFDYVREEEAAFKTARSPISDGYEWNMYEHVRKSTLYRDSKFTEGDNDGSRPFKNIIRRIINLQHNATGFDVKDIEPFVDNSENYHKSFLTRKFHNKWARKHSIDTFIDEMVESYVDFGLALVKHVNQIAPEVVPLQSIAFCDQTDILSGPICIKHQYSPAQLKEFEGKWKNIDDVIRKARKEKVDPNGRVTKTPGKFIEVYELDGTFPKEWLKDEGEEVYDEDQTTYSQQLHIITFYKDDNGDKKGITLFKGKGDPKKYKAIKRDPIFGRACGFGGIEELFEAQVWTNYNEIRIQGMLDVVSKVLGITDDPAFATRNVMTEKQNGEFMQVAEGKRAEVLDMKAPNLPAFVAANERWEMHAQNIGSANDALLGESPTSGTPFKLQELVTYQGKGPHEYRKGKMATFLGEIYRDWILADLVKEMNNEQEFMEELTLDELQFVCERIVDCKVYDKVKRALLDGKVMKEDEVDTLKEVAREAFMKGGNKRFFKLLKDELKSLPMDVEVNIAGKQKNLALMADKLGNIWSKIWANPQGFVATMQIPGAASSFNEMMEASGMSPINFAAMSKELREEITQPEAEEPEPVEAAEPLQVAQANA